MTEGFVEVDEIDTAKQAKRVFSGWMFAASPGLHGVEHPVYDVWLKDCKGGVEVDRLAAGGRSRVNAQPPPNARRRRKGGRPQARRTIDATKGRARGRTSSVGTIWAAAAPPATRPPPAIRACCASK